MSNELDQFGQIEGHYPHLEEAERRELKRQRIMVDKQKNVVTVLVVFFVTMVLLAIF